jgi:hypothetical protein
MTTEIEKQIEITKSAYNAGFSAIIQSMGKHASHELVFDVVALLGLHVVTGGNNLSPEQVAKNKELFCQRLAAYIADAENQPFARLM